MTQGANCAACGRPFDAAVIEIGRKVRRLRFFGDVSRRWTRRGARLGFLAAVALAPVFVLFYLASWLWGPSLAGGLWRSFLQLASSVVAALILLPFLGMGLGLILGAVIRPVCIALFCSIERFEQEYGSTRR